MYNMHLLFKENLICISIKTRLKIYLLKKKSYNVKCMLDIEKNNKI